MESCTNLCLTEVGIAKCCYFTAYGGIMVEGLLIEAGVLVLETNALGLALGGGLAMISVLFF